MDTSHPTGSEQGILASLRQLRWRAYAPALLVLLVGAAVTWATYREVTGLERSRVESAFADAARDRVLVVQREIRDGLDVVQDLGSFFDAIERVGRRQFREFVQPVLKRDPSIRFLAWAPRVAVPERDAFLARERPNFPPLEIHSAATDNASTGAPVSVSYFPLLYLQPYQPNETPLGLDLGTLPREFTVLERAAETGRMQVLESPSSLLGDSGEREFAAYLPVYSHSWSDNESELEMPTSPAQPPREALRGYVIGRFAVTRVIERALSNLGPSGIDMRFTMQAKDGTEQLMYWHSSRTRTRPLSRSSASDATASDWRYTGRLQVADHHWTVLCSSVPGKFQPETWVGRVVLAGGAAFTLLFAGYLLTLEGRAARIKRLVSQRTSELEVANVALNQQMAERLSAEQALQALNSTLELRVARRTSESERRAAELEQFAYVASHDLKAPLRAIANLTEWLEEDLADKLTTETREQLNLLRDRVARMHGLIEGLLTYSRVGRTEEALSEVDSAELVSQTLDSLAPPQGFEFLIAPGMPTLVTDRLQLGQVFANLIGNSIKHHHGDRGHVHITGQDQGDYCEFVIADDGPGIAPEYHDKVFKMFQTLRVSDFQSDTGIGLALVKKIVEEHGGRIELTSALGAGSTFRFTWSKEKYREISDGTA